MIGKRIQTMNSQGLTIIFDNGGDNYPYIAIDNKKKLHKYDRNLNYVGPEHYHEMDDIGAKKIKKKSMIKELRKVFKSDAWYHKRVYNDQ